ncbi:MAG: lytic murein transglycosylase B [Gammaproteobacteria bacterium]|nr:lytic murein transglycosylase B [Gammaproteobacteria bacterium]
MSLIVFVCGIGNAWGLNVPQYPLLTEFIERMVTEHGFSRQELGRVFTDVTLRPQVIEAIRRPSERLPWHRYRQLFLTDANIENGVRFATQHAPTLRRAEQEFGVPAEIIVAIIGVETRYGQSMGGFPVLDSLTTLTLEYPRRSAFFKRELEQFLLLAREQGLDPRTTKGSYAGAMGVPQFIASSYREYAVDFNGDRRTDLMAQEDDAIGSVGNYLARHRWRAGGPVVSDPVTPPDAARERASTELKPRHTAAELVEAGVAVPPGVPPDTKAGLLRVANGVHGDQFRIAFENFYVVTKYNRSINYALAVVELSRQIAQRWTGQ